MAHTPSIRPYSTETVVSSTWFFRFPALIFLSFGIYTSFVCVYNVRTSLFWRNKNHSLPNFKTNLWKNRQFSPVVKWHFFTQACFAVWTMFYDWFWFSWMSCAGISRVPLWHPWAEFCKGKNKMAAKYFKVKYDFSTNEARSKCNTSFSCDLDWAIHFLYYFDDSRSSSRSKRQFQGQISKNTIFTK